MNKWLKVILIACLSIVLPVNNLSAQHVLEEIAEQLITNDEDNAYQWENLFEELSDLKENPLNINSATKEQLERFPFLNSQLIENILYYLYKYGAMVSINELMVVEDMDLATFRLLKPFITCQPLEEKTHTPTLKSILKYGKQELSARMDIPLYTRAGYQPFTSDYIKENPNNRYLGPSFYHNLRYKFRYTDKVYIGFTAEKDPGEPFFAGNNKKGYDYYSPYFYIRDFGKIRALALGNYRLDYGYGLVMNTDFNMGKTTALNTLLNRESGIKKHSSKDEYNYFQGIAGSIQLSEHFTADAFYSYRLMDGSVDNRFITSLKEDGYHRIPRDYEKKNSLTNQLIGSNIQYNGKNFELGLTAVYNFFNKVLNPTYRPYNKYYPRGSDFFNLGANYKFFLKKLTWMGEVAMDKDRRMAALNTLRYRPKANFQLIAMHRFYDVAYQSMYARSVGEGSMVQNESGFYLGMEADELWYFKLTAYIDFFYFPWKKYQMTKNGTRGIDGVIQLDYSPNHELDMFIRYRYKNKFKDYNPTEGDKITVPYFQQKGRYQLTYSPNDELVLKTTADVVHNAYQHKDPSKGFLIKQSIGYKFPKLPLQLDASVAWFKTDDYASRITVYEKSLLYSFSMPSFYGEGERFSFNTRYELNKHIVLQGKYACTHYRDREVISSGLEQIEGNLKSDLYFQVQFKF